MENLARDLPPSQARELNFTPRGGAYNRVPASATAFVHRAELYLVEHAVVIAPDASSPEHEAAHDWLASSWTLTHPFGSGGGVYPNFPDPGLENPGLAYYGENYERLLRVKAHYDPNNVFRFHQSLSQPSDQVAAANPHSSRRRSTRGQKTGTHDPARRRIDDANER